MTPYTLAALATEINTDPVTLGYAPAKVAGSASQIAALLNSTYGAVTTVYRKNIPAGEILSGIVWAEVSAFTAARIAAIQLMLSTGTVDGSSQNIRDFFAGALTGANTSKSNLDTISKVAKPTRAEELWGAGTVVSASDIASIIRS